MKNATRWNQLHRFEGLINNEEFQAMEFFAGSDAALRIESLNGESLVGLYGRYGFVGEGLIGVVPTKLLRKAIPDFFHPSFYGTHARISGRLALCPAQHGFVAQAIARKSGIDLDVSKYKNTHYLQINRISPATGATKQTCSLLGSAWAVTENSAEKYLIEYGYFSESAERDACNTRIIDSEGWRDARVFHDEIESPSEDFSFRRTFIR